MKLPSQDSLEPAPDLLIAIDPGKTSGVALFRNGQVADLGQHGLDSLIDYLENLSPTTNSKRRLVIVYENFRLRKGKALQQSGSMMEASQVIGICKAFAKRNGFEIYTQEPNIKPIAQKWSKVVPKGSHNLSHSVDAYNHGFYWLVRQGMRLIVE